MRKFDRLLQRWRIDKVRPYVLPGSRVLDIGSSDGALYEQIEGLGEYLGIEPGLDRDRILGPKGKLLRGEFPQDLPDRQPFDVICMLAVLEHLPPAAQQSIAVSCFEYLKPSGHLVITVPAPQADYLLGVLKFLKIIDGMSLEQHHGFHPGQTRALFEAAGLRLTRSRRFQFGFNNLFVFQRSAIQA